MDMQLIWKERGMYKNSWSENPKKSKHVVRLEDNIKIQGSSNMTGTDLCVNKPHCAAAVRP